MIDPEENKPNQEIEQKIRAAFPIQDPDQLFIDSLQNKLADRFKDDERSTVRNEHSSKRSPWLDRSKLLFSPLAWGVIGILFILFLVWGIRTLVPRVEPSISSQSTPSPSIEPSIVPTQAEGIEGTINLPIQEGMPIPWPEEAITAENAYKVTLLSRLGKGSINGIAWSPDDKTLAISSSTGIYLYETANFEQIKTIDNSKNVYSVVYSPDGAKLAANEGAQVKIWEVDSGKEIHTLSVETEWPGSLAFSPDGSWLAARSGDNRIKLWDTTSGNEIDILTSSNENEMIGQLVFSADGTMMVSLAYPVSTFPDGTRGTTGYPGTIRVWDVAGRTELRTLPDCMGYTMALSPDSQTVAVQQEQAIVLCDIKSGSVINKLGVNPDYYLAFSPDGTMLVGSVKNAIILWKVPTMEEALTLPGQDEEVYYIAFSPDGSRLASASLNSVKIWDTANGQELYTLVGHTAINNDQESGQLEGYEGYINDVAFSPDRKILATVNEEGPLRLYAAKTGMLLAELETQVGFNYRVTFSPDGKLVAVCGGRYEPVVNGVQIWDVATREPRLKLDGFNNSVWSVAFSPDGVTLATAEGTGWGFQGAVKLWNLTTGELLQEFGIKSGENPVTFRTVFDVAFSPDGSHLAAASGDGVLLWDVSEQMQEAVLTSTGTVMKVSFSPKGNLLATAGWADINNNTTDVRLWDLTTGETLFILEGPRMVPGIAFNPDGRILASGDRDGNVGLWDVETGKSLATLDGVVSSPIAFSPDGTLLVTGGDYLHLWGISPSNTSQPEVTHETIGGGVTPTPQPPAEIKTNDIGMDKTLLPILSTGEAFQPGIWSQDGSYFFYGEQGPINEQDPDQAILSLHFLVAQTGETCDSLQETVKMVDSWGAQIPEGASLYERTKWIADNRLLYISPDGELFAITPCKDSTENWSASLPESIRSFAWAVGGEDSIILIKGGQADWLFSPSTQKSVKLALSIPPEGEETSFAWSNWDNMLVASRLERREGELWIILEQIDTSTGVASRLYEIQASPSLEYSSPMGAFVEWVGKGLLLLSDTISDDQLIDVSSQSIKFTNLYPDLFGMESPSDTVTIWGVEPGATGGQDYHLYFGTGLSTDGKFYLYHGESGLVDTLPFDQYLLLVFLNHKTVIAQPWSETPPSGDIFRVTYVDSSKETYELVVKGHSPREGSWLSALALPDAKQILFSSIQGISLVELDSGEMVNFWVFEDQEKYQDFSTSLSPDGKTVVGFASQRDPNLPDWTQAMYWLRLEP